MGTDLGPQEGKGKSQVCPRTSICDSLPLLSPVRHEGKLCLVPREEEEEEMKTGGSCSLPHLPQAPPPGPTSQQPKKRGVRALRRKCAPLFLIGLALSLSFPFSLRTDLPSPPPGDRHRATAPQTHKPWASVMSDFTALDFTLSCSDRATERGRASSSARALCLGLVHGNASALPGELSPQPTDDF